MFCKQLQPKIKRLIRQFDAYLETHVDLALRVTKALKSVLQSPVTDIITAIIPGDLDELIRHQLIAGLEKAIAALSIVDACRVQPHLAEQMQCFVTELNQRDPELRDAILAKLASLLAGHLDSQRFRQNVYDMYTQAKYTAEK